MRTFAPACEGAKGRVGEHQVEAAGRSTERPAASQVGAYGPYHAKTVQCRVALDQRCERRLNFQGDYFARPCARGEDQPNHAASRAQLQYASGGARGGKARQQHRLHREAVAAAWLVKAQRSA